MFQNSKLATEPSDIVQCNTKTVQKVDQEVRFTDPTAWWSFNSSSYCLPQALLHTVQGARCFYAHCARWWTTMNDCANDCSCSNICWTEPLWIVQRNTKSVNCANNGESRSKIWTLAPPQDACRPLIIPPILIGLPEMGFKLELIWATCS